MNYSFRQFALVAFMGIGLAGCFENHDHEVEANKKSIASIDDGLPADAPTYLAVTDAAYEPYSYRGEFGQVIGFESDVLNAIAKDQGFRVKYMIQPWNEVLSSVENGTRDIAAAGVYYNAERAKRFNLSPPHLQSPEGIVWLGKEIKINNFEDLKNYKVSTLADSKAVFDLEKSGVIKADIVTESTMFLAFKNLLSGKVQAVVGDGVVLQHFVQQYKDDGYDLQYKNYAFGDIGNITFVMNKNNKELYDKVLAGLKNIRVNGTLQRLKSQWFGKQG